MPYLPEDCIQVDKLKGDLTALCTEAIMHASEGRFDKKDFHLSQINNILSELRELHLKLDDEAIKVRGSMF